MSCLLLVIICHNICAIFLHIDLVGHHFFTRGFSNCVHDMPCEVFQRVKEILCKENSEGERTQWTFLGHKVCLRCWKALHGLGSMIDSSQSHIFVRIEI